MKTKKKNQKLGTEEQPNPTWAKYKKHISRKKINVVYSDQVDIFASPSILWSWLPDSIFVMNRPELLIGASKYKEFVRHLLPENVVFTSDYLLIREFELLGEDKVNFIHATLEQDVTVNILHLKSGSKFDEHTLDTLPVLAVWQDQIERQLISQLNF